MVQLISFLFVSFLPKTLLFCFILTASIASLRFSLDTCLPCHYHYQKGYSSILNFFFPFTSNECLLHPLRNKPETDVIFFVINQLLGHQEGIDDRAVTCRHEITRRVSIWESGTFFSKAKISHVPSLLNTEIHEQIYSKRSFYASRALQKSPSALLLQTLLQKCFQDESPLYP